MNTYLINGKNFNIEFEVSENSACILKGNFGEIALEKSHFFIATIKNLKTNEKKEITSLTHWNTVNVSDFKEYTEFSFVSPDGILDITFNLKAIKDKDYIEWEFDVLNNNPDWSVVTVSYPSPVASSKNFDFFIPATSGRVIKNAGQKGYYADSDDEFVVRMHYFAVYGKKDGIYIGIEDENSFVKRYRMGAKDNKAEIRVDFIGIDANKGANSFKVAGNSKWQYFEGDWYDATMIYKDFVEKRANWLPKINETGRPDTPLKFKEVPAWIYDYMPNSEHQRDNYPKTLALRNYPDDYWYKAAIKLKEEIGVPLAYHVYNWHHIPFNVEYPHFMPAKEEFKEGVKELKKHDIYILPYINSVSWEADDKLLGHEINFENTGKYGCGIREDGTNCVYIYPQTTIEGKNVDLVQMCPSFKKWHEINYDTVRRMEKELDIDGVYFDQVSACIGRPCYNPLHNHTTGGGSYWVDGYNEMMEKINSEKPKDSFYFSECNTEGYMKSFDGFLTWMWAASGEVPAFPAVYSGYIQLVGRMTEGKKKEDRDFFKFQTAKSLHFGQQIGWCNADVVYDNEKLDFFKKAVRLRYKYKDLFISSKMLRPPYVKCDLEPKITTPHLKFKSDVEMEQVLASAWQFKNKSKIVIFITNIANKEANFELYVNKNEFNLDNYTLPQGFEICGDKCIIKGKLAPTECKAWEFDLKCSI